MDWKTKATALIKQFEGLRLYAYHGDLDRPGLLTIGYGATGPSIKLSTRWTQQQADDDLSQRIDEFAKGVDQLVKVALNSNEKAALVSFVYNLGLESLRKSTLLKLLNAGDYNEAAKQILVWNKAGGITRPGLVRRREAEKKLFDLGEDDETN